MHFIITSIKLYVPFVTLHKFLENRKQGFKRKIYWNKYRSEITTQTKNNNLDYLINPTFTNINRLLVLSFKNVDDDPTISYFDEHYMLLVEIKYFNVLIDNKSFFDQPVNSSKKRMKNVSKCKEIMII